jgi:hypothetical protein
MRKPLEVFAGFPLEQRELVVEEHIEFLYPHAKQACKRVMSQFMKHDQNAECQYQFQGLYPE